MTAEARPKEILSLSPDIQFGSYIPVGRLTNDEIGSWQVKKQSGKFLTSDGITETVGVVSRSIAAPYETTQDMAFCAIEEMTRKGMGHNFLPDLVIATTSFPNGQSHSGAIVNEWGLDPKTPHLDIHAACSGFVKGLVRLFEQGDRWYGADIAIISTEIYSPHVHDLRSGIEGDPALSQTIFSDGAVGMKFRLGRDLKILAARNFPMFDKNDLIGMPIDDAKIAGPVDREVSDMTMKTPEIFQNGGAVFKHMGNNIPRFVRSLVEEAGVDPKGLATFLHQGSIRVIGSLQESLSEQNVIIDIEDGNYSSATIPRMLSRASLERGQRAVLVGFGAGLFASGAVVEFG